MTSALDTASPTTNSLLALKNAGFTTAIRYLWQGDKGATARELSAITAVFGGTQPCVLVYEAEAATVLGGEAAGRAGGTAIEALMSQLGLGAAAPVYAIAADFDALPDQLAAIRQFEVGLRGTLAPARKRGVYGNGLVCAGMDPAYVAYSWLLGGADTQGTAAFSASGRWSVRQHPTVEGYGLSYDPDDLCDGDHGGFRYPISMKVGDHGDDVRLLQHLVGLSGPQVDGAFGEQTEQALGRWLAAREYPQATAVDDELWAKLTGLEVQT